MKTLVLIGLFFFISIQSFSQQNDTIKTTKWHQKPIVKIALIPSVFIGYGCSVIGKNKVITSSFEVRDWRNKNFKYFHNKADDYLVYVPAATSISLNLCGVKTKNNFKKQILYYAAATLLSNLIIQPLKYSTKILRPDSSARNSFPSGHTTGAFVSAEMMHQELGKTSIWYSVGAYGVAASVGTMRILNNRHWFADVLVGAGIGMLSTKLVYYVGDKIEKRRAKKISNKLLLKP